MTAQQYLYAYQVLVLPALTFCSCSGRFLQKKYCLLNRASRSLYPSSSSYSISAISSRDTLNTVVRFRNKLSLFSFELDLFFCMNSCFSLSLFFFFGRAGARRVETQIYYFCVVGTEKHTQACGLSACRSCTRAGTSSLASSSTTATRPATTPAGRCPPTLTLLVNDTSVSISSSA